MIGGLSIRVTDSFKRDYDRLSEDLQGAVKQCLMDLEMEVVPQSRRLHSVSPKGKKPTVYSADVTSNKSHKLTFQIDGRVAVLRRVATHRQIDRTP